MRDVEYEGQGERTHKRLTDLSQNGVYIDTINPLPVGASITLQFTLPDDHVVHATGVVRYHQPGAGMGIEFTDISPADRRRVEHWIGRLS